MNGDLYNRKHNAKNPNQGEDKKVLTVCSAGLLRSPTLANVLSSQFGYNVRPCGTYKGYALVILDEVLIEWADEIVFVNKENYEYASMHYDLLGKAFHLDVPDMYPYNDPELRDICLKQYMKVVLEKDVDG